MSKRKDYGGIDIFRIIAAFLVVGIHTAPFEELSTAADRLVTYGIGRVGVPFFLMVTGYFVLSECDRNGGSRQRHKLIKYLSRTFRIYLAVTLLYLPVAAYAGNLPKGIGEWIKGFCMDGLFYHLWYFPAVIIGSLITALCLWHLRAAAGGLIVSVLYIIGLLGDSWYGLTEGIAPVRGLYELLFHISSYTRNGFLFAPLFLWMGAMLGKAAAREAAPETAQVQETAPEKGGRGCGLWSRLSVHPAGCFGLCAIVLLMMLTEGWFTWKLGWQRHDSMYLFLIPVMLFLMKGLLAVRCHAPKLLRPVSMWIYLLHPLCIVGIRGVSKVLGLWQILVENQLIFYGAVCISATGAALVMAWLQRALQTRRKGKAALQQIRKKKGEENVSEGKSMD